MTEYSGPVEEMPLPAKDWPAVTQGIGSGILDEGAFPYNLINLSNATNTAELTAANLGDNIRRSQAILGGFYHKIDQNLTVELPAVTKATTYYVALQLDPIRATEGGRPVVAGVFTTLDRTSGKDYLVLHEIDRAPNQLLTDATHRFVRPRVAPTIVVSRPRELPPASSVLWGTTAVIHGGYPGIVDLRVAVSQDEGNSSKEWKSILSPPWERLPDTTNAVRHRNGVAKSIQRIGRTRKVTGRIRRSDDSVYAASASAGYLVASLDSKDLPAGAQRFTVRGNGQVTGYVEANRQDAELRLWINESNTPWVDLGVLEYTADEWV